MNIATWDIEATSLKADQGFLLCCGFKPLHRQPYVIGLKESKREKDPLKIDRYLAIRIREELERYDMLVGWNSLMFDRCYVNDRLTLSCEDILERRFHVDAMWFARMGQATFTSSRLDWASRVLDVSSRKTPLDITTWKRAEAEARGGFRGKTPNYDQIVHHCKMDLKVTEEVYEKLKPRISNISKR